MIRRAGLLEVMTTLTSDSRRKMRSAPREPHRIFAEIGRSGREGDRSGTKWGESETAEGQKRDQNGTETGRYPDKTWTERGQSRDKVGDCKGTQSGQSRDRDGLFQPPRGELSHSPPGCSLKTVGGSRRFYLLRKGGPIGAF